MRSGRVAVSMVTSVSSGDLAVAGGVGAEAMIMLSSVLLASVNSKNCTYPLLKRDKIHDCRSKTIITVIVKPMHADSWD